MPTWEPCRLLPLPPPPLPAASASAISCCGRRSTLPDLLTRGRCSASSCRRWRSIMRWCREDLCQVLCAGERQGVVVLQRCASGGGGIARDQGLWLLHVSSMCQKFSKCQEVLQAKGSAASSHTIPPDPSPHLRSSAPSPW